MKDILFYIYHFIIFEYLTDFCKHTGLHLTGIVDIFGAPCTILMVNKGLKITKKIHHSKYHKKGTKDWSKYHWLRGLILCFWETMLFLHM